MPTDEASFLCQIYLMNPLFLSFHSVLLPDPQKKDVNEIARKSQLRAIAGCGIWEKAVVSFTAELPQQVWQTTHEKS